MKCHRDLDVWKKGMQFANDVYKTTESFPKHELYGLTSQIRRAAVSIPSNIAEGAARHSKKEFIQFLYCSLGSCSELETQLELSEMLGYVDGDSLGRLMGSRETIAKMLFGLIKSLKR